jgi:ADP-ribosylglycohydrolase
MLGAIIGDIIGSTFEFIDFKSKDFELFPPGSKFTDDTVLTIAVADAIINDRSYRDCIIEWGRKYPDSGYGTRFLNFLSSSNPEPYNSFGNGSAMRVSPVGWLYNTKAEVLLQAKLSAVVSHNHPEGIKGAQSVALAIYMARKGESKKKIKEEITTRLGYDLDRSLEEVRKVCRFDETCQVAVPESFIAFFESENFEDCIRNAISLGGDSDTQAAIAGSLAEAFYGGIPAEILSRGMAYLDKEILDVIGQFLNNQ